MLSLTFRINLTPPNSGLLSNTEASQLANTMNVFLPGLLAGENILKNHGEIFTLTGLKAIYLKDLIEKNNISHIELYTEPIAQNNLNNVEYLDLYNLGLNVFANWQYNNENFTDLQIKINDNEWISLDTFEIGVGSTAL